MDLTRRHFIRNVFLLLAPIIIAPRKWTRAIRARIYPGPVGPLDPAQIRHPAKWAG
ncbi:MAG TPA: hypothetical protein VMZ06_10300 [Candidatus Bathyarchaeia archaeon]|nr:hypothetical protein [Candidatus Bathyarchaeia archaeon]